MTKPPEDCYRKDVVVEGKIHTLEITDVAGRSDVKSRGEEDLKNGTGFLVVYSVDSSDSLDVAKEFVKFYIDKKGSPSTFPM